MELKERISIVTGASSGIGKATAKLLGEKGSVVILVSRNKSKLDALSKEIPNSMVIKTDMSKNEEVRKMINLVYKQFGKIDILVNNAGRGYDELVEKTDIKTFRQLIELDLFGPFIAMQEVIPIMKKQKTGTIVNISSGTSLMYLPNMSAYSSTKRALNGLSLTAREELKSYGIKVSIFYPFITETDFEKNMFQAEGKRASLGDDSEVNNHLPPADSADYVARKIVDLIKSGKAEGYSHDWMKDMTKKSDG